ncbi:hypothetical protein, conserved [Babesia ovata]|uniref:Extracellular matrix-binding ebh n=1 Tax=Babesia ovata TaxID=189622 RepID=A0A2H6KJJ4_9APIC|nr:uncharacterized protein BOVATA_046660 [Babesia ovata]GBE63173.1 hypothetical protein, conserved [Babesia ovata]
MSFLHGVLHNIQPKLGQHKDTLDSALNSLKVTNDNGIAKYRAAIAAVEGCVRRYNNEVAASNSKVAVKRYEQKTLDVEFSETALSTAVKVEQAEKSINLKVQECQEHAKKFTNALDITIDKNALNNAISDLNATLKDKLESVRKTVEYESARLGRVKGQEHTEMTQAIKKIEEVMRALKSDVDCKIDTQVKLFVSKVREQVEPILAELKKISKSLHDYVAELGRWIDSANSAVDKALEMVKKILYEVNEEAVTNNPGRMKAAIDQIGIMINELVTAGNTGLDEVRKEVTEALKQVVLMNGKIMADLKGVRDGIIQGLSTYFDTLKSALESGIKEAGKDAWDSKKNGFTELKQKLGDELGHFEKAFGSVPEDAQKAVAYRIHNALHWISEATKKLNGETPDANKILDPIRSALSTKISGILDEQVGEEDGGVTVTLPKGPTQFQGYKSYVDQTQKNPPATSGNPEPIDGLLPKAIKNIRTQVQNALDDVGNINIHVEERLREVKDNLSLLCRAVKNAAETDPNSALKKLNELKNKYFTQPGKDANSIHKIHSNITNLRNELAEKPIQKTNDLLAYLTKAQNHYIKQLQEDVRKDIKQATDKLTTHARRQYAEALKFALRQFAAKVTGELRELPGEIDNDKHIGLKGFMEAFYGPNSGDNINKLKDGIDLRTVCHGLEKFLGPSTHISAGK